MSSFLIKKGGRSFESHFERRHRSRFSRRVSDEVRPYTAQSAGKLANASTCGYFLLILRAGHWLVSAEVGRQQIGRPKKSARLWGAD